MGKTWEEKKKKKKKKNYFVEAWEQTQSMNNLSMINDNMTLDT